MKLIPTYPYRDLDGVPHPGCDHQTQTTDAVERLVIEGIGNAIIRAGVPRPMARVGEIVETTWGCERNARKKTRRAMIDAVYVGLQRHPQSMFYRPALRFLASNVDSDGKRVFSHGRMCPTAFVCRAGAWKEGVGDWCKHEFALEWLSRNGDVQRLPGRGVHFIPEA